MMPAKRRRLDSGSEDSGSGEDSEQEEHDNSVRIVTSCSNNVTILTLRIIKTVVLYTICCIYKN